MVLLLMLSEKLASCGHSVLIEVIDLVQFIRRLHDGKTLPDLVLN